MQGTDAKPMAHKQLNNLRPGTEIAAAIFAAFEDYNQEFRNITRRAQRRFEEREWKLGASGSD